MAEYMTVDVSTVTFTWSKGHGPWSLDQLLHTHTHTHIHRGQWVKWQNVYVNICWTEFYGSWTLLTLHGKVNTVRGKSDQVINAVKSGMSSWCDEMRLKNKLIPESCLNVRTTAGEDIAGALRKHPTLCIFSKLLQKLTDGKITTSVSVIRRV